METTERMLALATGIGFETAAQMDPKTIELREEVREMCAEGKCKAYGHNWTCPPACGDLEHCREVVARYEKGIIVQTVGELEDSLDFESMMEAGQTHKERIRSLAEKVREICPDALCLGAGGCTVCKECAYPDPCRFPEKAFSSMEGYGMLVSDVCKENGVLYYHGENTVTYVGCCLFN